MPTMIPAGPYATLVTAADVRFPYYIIPYRIGYSTAGVFAAIVICLAAPTRAQTPPDVSTADRVAIFKAAGAVQRGNSWVICADDPQGGGASLDQLRDINDDGRPEAVVSESGTFCYGFTGTGFQLLSKQPDGGWKSITGDIGIPEFLKTKGKDGWPDISVGGPGFCFPVQRWNGEEYVLDRHEYEGKPCQPD